MVVVGSVSNLFGVVAQVTAMAYPEDLNKEDRESAEDRLERLKQVRPCTPRLVLVMRFPFSFLFSFSSTAQCTPCTRVLCIRMLCIRAVHSGVRGMGHAGVRASADRPDGRLLRRSPS